MGGEMTEISECKLCRGKAELIIVPCTFDGPGWSFVKCTKCKVQMRGSDTIRCPSGLYQDRKEAEKIHDEDSIGIWNNAMGT
jgi:hypothetical protein